MVNDGTIYVGGIATIGTLSIGGDFTQTDTGELFMELAGPNDDCDHVYVAGTATLDGLLHVDLLVGYTPDVTDGFTLLGYNSRSGSFADVELPALSGGKHFETAYLSSAFVVWVAEDDPGMGG